jgi:ferredoxin-type protein NapF
MPANLSRRAFFTRPVRGAMPEPQSAAAAPRVVALVGHGCLAAQAVTCGTCADPCEPRALRIRPLLGGRALPVIDVAACTGCGDCLSVCPVGALSLVPAPSLAEENPCA